MSTIVENLDFQKFMDYLKDTFWTIVKYPFELWNALPDWLHWLIFGFILAFALFLAYVTIRYRDAWRYYG